MADPQANPGLDLHLALRGRGTRLELEAALREAVQSGRLAPGTRLPPSRSLAADLGVARNTVAEAFGQLVAEGWLDARVGAGTWVAEHPFAEPSGRPGAAPAATQPESRPPRYDLQSGSPDVSMFPRSEWAAALRRAVNSAPYDAFGNGDPRGRPELRVVLAGYLSRARGVRVTPERIVLASGFTQVLALLGRVARERGLDSAYVESYGHVNHRETVAAQGLRVQSIEVDESGARIAELAVPGLAVLTPAHQFPLGAALSAARRVAAVGWARDTGGVVVEDDYDGEFRYDRAAVGAMQALAPEQVVYAGTASKALAPGLRISWLVLPQAWVDDVVAAKLVADRFSPAIEQLALADLIESGAYDRQVRRCRQVYRRRRDHLVSALARRAPDVRLSGISAGLHAVADLPRRLEERAAVTAAEAKGVAVQGLSTFAAKPTAGRPGLVIGFGAPPQHAFTTAVARLAAVLAPT